MPADWITPSLAFEAVVTLLFKATLLLGLAWAAALLLRRASASIRHGVWGLALAALLLLPLVSAVVPPWEPDALPTPTLAPLFASAAPSPTDLAATSLTASLSFGGAPSLWQLLALVWLAGALLLLARLGRDAARVAWLTRHAHPIHDPALREPLNALTRRLGIRRRVRLVASADVPGVMTWGLLRPVVLLPEGAAGWTPERYRVVLLHELAHVRRFDYAWHLLAQVACALYWINPLAWAAAHRLHLAQEQSCDDQVLRDGTASHDYAAHLLALARAFLAPPMAQSSSLYMARPSTLKARVRAILDRESDRRPLSHRIGLVAVAGVTCLALPLAALDLSAAIVPPVDPIYELINMLQSAPKPQRAEAARALAHHDDDRALCALIDALSDDAPEVRANAAYALGRRAVGEALPQLQRMRTDPCPNVRAAVSNAIRRICKAREHGRAL